MFKQTETQSEMLLLPAEFSILRLTFYGTSEYKAQGSIDANGYFFLIIFVCSPKIF